jgi:predicted transcriptional regulator
MFNLIYPSLMFLNAFKYRDRITIIGDILKAVKESKNGRKLSQIMQGANLNYIQTKKYLNYLLNCHFLVVTEKETYVITTEGLRFLQFVEVQRIHSIR